MRRRLTLLVLLALLPGLQGCLVQFLTGRSIFEEGAGKLLFQGYGKLSTCDSEATAPGPLGPLTAKTCAFRLTGEEGEGSENDIESVFNLPAALATALVLIDPVIIQVPAGYAQAAGSWNFGVTPLAVQTGLSSVETQPGVFLTAEPGHELVIVDLPTSPMDDMPRMFELTIAKPMSGGPAGDVTVKALFTAKAEVDGKTYYLPVLPCVADFASIPPITVPANPSGQDLLAPILAALAQSPTKGCQNVTYAFSTTTTLPPSAETCDNCADDDGDGLVDFDDPQCCGGGAAALALARTQFAPRKTGTRVTLGGGLGKIDGFGTGPSPDVQVQVRDAGGKTLWCARVPSARLKGKKRSRRFRDRAGTLAGLQDLRLQGKKGDGSVKLAVRAKQAAFQTPAAGRLGVTVGLWNAGASPATARCLAAVEPFRARKKGVRFP